MNHGGDKLVTTPDDGPPSLPVKDGAGRGKKGKPVAIVKFGSASVPIYRLTEGKRVRFAIAYYREGKRLRQTFATIENAKKEAQFVAQRIQSGMQHLTDLKPHDRETYLTACRMLAELDVPLVVAVDDYVRSRKIAGAQSLAVMATEYSKYFGNVVRDATIPEIVKQLLESKKQDGIGIRYLYHLRTVLNRFAAANPGPILDMTSSTIDQWLRGLNVSPSSRNTMLLYVNLLFSFALERNYLPSGKPTAPSQLRKVQVRTGDVEIFTVDQFRQVIQAAPTHLIPLLAFSAFSGIRMAELARLDWSAVDLERGIIELRAGQTKTASRRIIPLADNLRAWIEPLARKGKVIQSGEYIKEATELARALGIEWTRNVLRHSYISYRIAKVKSADQVALEAGNSASVIFKHYRELTTEQQADEWFGILPKEGQWKNTYRFDRATRTVRLPKTTTG